MPFATIHYKKCSDIVNEYGGYRPIWLRECAAPRGGVAGQNCSNHWPSWQLTRMPYWTRKRLQAKIELSLDYANNVESRRHFEPRPSPSGP